MKLVILAGGFGTRISEESKTKPKPMVEIGGKPIIWHIMKLYSFYGISEFIICCGYKDYVIKEYFANYFLHNSDVTFDLKKNDMQVHNQYSEPWKVSLINTGINTMTGGRLKRVKKYIGNETFCFTYGDGLSNVNIKELIEFHKKHQKKATLTAVLPPFRFGSLDLEEEINIKKFKEKSSGNSSWVNGGFFVLNPSVIDYIKNDSISWENEPLQKLAQEGELKAFKHYDFWQPMDTLREKIKLEQMWQEGNPPWKVWND